MAISRLTGQDTLGSGGASPISAVYASTPTQNNLLVAAAYTNLAPGNASIAGWTLASEGACGSVAADGTVSIFWKIAGAAESKTVTLAAPGATSLRLEIYEFTGNATTGVTDGTSTPKNSGATNVTSLAATTAGHTTSNPDDLVFAAFAFTGTTSAWSADSSFNLTTVTNGRLVSATRITSATGTFNPTLSWTGSFHAGGAMAAFKASSTVAPPAATATAQAPAPAVSAAASVTPPAASQTAQAGAPAVSAAGTVAPPAATETAQAPIPAVSAAAAVAPPAGAVTAQAQTPAVSAAVTITPPATSSTARALTPRVTGDAENGDAVPVRSAGPSADPRTRLPGLEVVVDGRYLSAIAPWGDLTWSNRWPRGCNQASWGMALPRGARHPLLRRGAFVQLMHGPLCRWCGQLGEPNWTDATFTAYGLARSAGGFVAVDGSTDATTTPSVAAAAAAAAGWPITVDASVPATPLTETTDQLLMVDQLLDTSADETGQRWTVWADGVLRMEPDPTTPTWHLRPEVADLSTAEDNYASTAVVVYTDTLGAYAKVIVPDPAAIAAHGVWQKPLDFTAYGQMDETTATNIATGVLAKGRSELGWANGLTVTPSELMTAGGRPASMVRVRAGQSVRVHARAGSLPGMAGRTHRDLVIEEDDHQNQSDEVALKFLGTAARTDDEVTRELFAAIGRSAA